MSKKFEEPSGSTSICCDESKAPIRYHWFAVGKEPGLMDAFKMLLAEESLLELDRDRFVGEFRARMRQAVAGLLKPVDNLKGPMREETRLELFEIRWRFEHGDTEELRVRLYHAEPRTLQRPSSAVAVGLHIHKKNVDRGVDVNAAQDAEIARASDRFYEGRPDFWGVQK